MACKLILALKILGLFLSLGKFVMIEVWNAF